jgi:DNA-binding transcriptional regulator YdaS (Cro superfamily)
MDFPTWLRSQPRGTAKRLERETGVGSTTIQRCMQRIPAGPGVALRLSAATGGAVSPAELSFPPPVPDEENAPNSELGSEIAS